MITRSWGRTMARIGLVALWVSAGAATAWAQEAAPPAEQARVAGPSSGGKSLPAFQDADNRVYLIELKGVFARDIHFTPFKQMMDDAKRFNPDIVVIKIDAEFQPPVNESGEPADEDPGTAYNQLDTVRQMSLIFTDEVRDAPDWKTRKGEKPRIIVWVKRGMGPAAFLPFVVPEIYFAPDAHMGGIGGFEHLFANRGDKVVQEKMHSLSLARAEGLAEKGGHDPRLMKAMTREAYVLSVSFVDGKPVFFEDESGEVLLTDDPNIEGKRDKMEDILRFKGNDSLTLDAPTAFKVGLSKGTVETVDDLASELGIARSYVLLPGRAATIGEKWTKDLAEEERDITKMWRDYQRIAVGGATAAERNKARNQQIRKLTELKQSLMKYKGAINLRKVGMPGNWEQSLDNLIGNIKEEIRRDR